MMIYKNEEFRADKLSRDERI